MTIKEELLAKKNAELEIELTAKNRELEIEAALEKVRAVAMSMKEPADMLEVCRIISHQLETLHVKEIRNVQTAIFYESKSTYMNYEYYAKHDKTFITETTYTNNEIHNAFATQMLKGKGEFFITHIKGNEVKDWIAYQKTTNVFIDDYLNTASSLNYYWYSLGSVALGISTYERLKKEETDLFKRFLKVFELSYTRYLDIEQAQAQAREAQIEAALERVRARTMGMHKSEELKEVIQLVYEQFIHLNIYIEHTGFLIDYKARDDMHIWLADEHLAPSEVTIPWFDSPPNNSIKEAKEKGRDFFTYHLAFDEKNKFYRDLFKFVPGVPEETLEYYFNCSGLAGSGVLLENIGLYIENFTGTLYSDEENAILMRFGKVFQQTYIRFLDLQKAEVQAREAQIELGLERVRARAMAMRESEELNALAGTLFNELTRLNFVLVRFIIITIDPRTESCRWFMANPENPLTPKDFFIQYHEHPGYLAVLKAWKERLSKWVYVNEGELKKKWGDFLLTETELSTLPEAVKAGMVVNEKIFMNMSFGNFGALLISTTEPLPDEHFNILLRFAKVFDLTYTRFSDLKLAEAQAREAQIEAALERVRSKAMAMHKSDDLNSAVAIVFEELDKLNLGMSRCGIGILDKEKRSADVYTTTISDNNTIVQVSGDESMDIHPLLRGAFEAWLKEAEDFSYVLQGDDLVQYYKALQGGNFTLPESQLILSEKHAQQQFYYVTTFNAGGLFAFRDKPFPEEAKKTMKRFAGVFNLTYKRFLDLQKAEAQARQAQIELGLERVRNRAMAMQTSEELSALIGTVFTELTKLDLVLTRCVILIYEGNERGFRWWMANSEAPSMPMNFFVKYADMPFFNEYLKGWQERSLKWQYILEGENKFSTDEFLFKNTELSRLPDFVIAGMRAPERVYLNASFNNFGNLTLASLEPLSDEQFDIMLRFARVFDLTYTRFNDLKQAEAQARESQIEAALERLRSKTMAMHNSANVGETVAVLFDELKKLGIETIRCGIGIMQNTKNMEVWTAKPNENDKTDLIIGHLDMDLHPLLQGAFKGWSNKKESFSYELKGDDLVNYFTAINNHPAYPVQYNMATLPSTIYHNDFFFSEGTLFAFSVTQLSDENKKICKRFAGVFGQTYRRYLDLQKAEAQAREAQIEAALERVRASAMAMHTSDGILEVVHVLREQVAQLGEKELESILVHVYHEDRDKFDAWYAYRHPESSREEVINAKHDLDWSKTARARKDKEKYHGNETEYTIVADYKMLKEWYQYLLKVAPEVVELDDKGNILVPDVLYYNYSKFSGGTLLLITNSEASQQSKYLLKRAAKVFNLAYSRFLDLKQAEAQAREAKIEAALERVRGKAMAMQNSNDLSIAASMVFTELRRLGINPIRCGVGLLSKETRKAQLYSATSSDDGDSLALVGWVMLSGHPTLEKIYTAWLEREDYFPELSGEQLKSYYEQLLAGLSVKVPDWEDGQKQYGHFLSFSVGCLYAWSNVRYNEAEIKVLKRFASIIDLTFRRYMELQKSEANAREAVKQAALDRIRADIASMRTVGDLDRITPLIWNELTILGLSFIRCGVFIMDETEHLIHTFLSTPDGKAIAAFHLPFTTPGNFGVMLNHWLEKKIYIDHWTVADFNDIAEILVSEGAIATKEQYINSLPGEGFYLHFLPFLQGMLYVGNLEELNQEQITLIQHVAEAFSTAYARYEDFNKLEAAKQQVEKTLADLKQAQQQLVQSEKMASLGELTAGIAHEIQNPLNFVNNFSEVNKEMLEELLSEKSKVRGERNEELETELLNDIKANEEKINHHGKRADAIVKSMLQHSRKTKGLKEPTDINALCDEYLRLSFHGMRAKDKSFNADFKTDFDDSIGKINIIPQDMGRVLLNLFNNAFYAVNEKRKLMANSYKPLAEVKTLRINDKVEIIVRDNGNGIPQNIVDKIFQPFFTTKPTGEGTGLGLSLSYDIITKEHSGTIKVESKEGEGSEFRISLPLTT